MGELKNTPQSFKKGEKKMRKMSLANYMISVRDQHNALRFITFKVRDSLVSILTHPSLGLNGPELLAANELADKIEAETTAVLLTDEEYLQLVDSCKRFRGFSRNDAELLKRIYNCPEVPNEGEKKDEDKEFSEN